MSDKFDKIDKLPIWKEKYSKLGVSPRELYMRQNGLCWLKPVVDSEGRVAVYCTDGKDAALTESMLNPTIECVQCMMGFTKQVMERDVEKNRTTSGEEPSGSDT